MNAGEVPQGGDEENRRILVAGKERSYISEAFVVMGQVLVHLPGLESFWPSGA